MKGFAAAGGRRKTLSIIPVFLMEGKPFMP